MRVLITGGCGFIGSHLVEKFHSEGYDIRILGLNCQLENIEQVLKKNNVEFIRGDIRNRKICDRAVKDCEYVCHLAALISVDHSIEEPRPFWDVNVGGTFNILDAAYNEGVKKFQYMSSCEMLGHIDHPHKATEEWKTYIPRSPYAASKLAAETYCNSYFITYDFPIVITRAFNVFGPRQSPGARGAMIAKFITMVLNNEAPTIFGDGEQIRDWTYVKDVAEGIYMATTSKEGGGETFHLASGIDRKVIDVAKKIIEVCGKGDKLKLKFGDARLGELRRSCGDATKIKKIIGWEPKISFEDGIEKTVNFFKNQPTK